NSSVKRLLVIDPPILNRHYQVSTESGAYHGAAATEGAEVATGLLCFWQFHRCASQNARAMFLAP
ncbi:hypothetical protein KK141_21070, partial [Dyella sp. LX-66]|uniref:hypothetical protein n=1 Tax=Dyella sp. LX-66 TaxID=2838832 RepID=UPI001BE11AFB